MVDRVAPALDGWERHWFEPFPVPAVYAFCLRPDPGKFADYQQVMGSYTKWFLRLGLYAPAANQEEARLKMGDLTDPRGQLISRLLSDEIEDDLYELCAQDVQVTTGRGWDVVRRARARHLYADLGVVCGAN